MTDHPRVIPAGIIARRLMIPLPLEEETRYILEEASSDAQSDLEAYLGRSVVPVTYTQHHARLGPRGWIHLDNYPVRSVTSWTPETGPGGQPSGLFTVVYVAGLDSVNDEDLKPVRRFITLSAMHDPAVQALYRVLRPDLATRVMSGSVQGQSATITDVYPSAAAAAMRSPAAVTAQMSMPGSPPTLQTCDRWRISKRRVYQRPALPGDAAPWPFDRHVEGDWEGWAGQWETWWQ